MLSKFLCTLGIQWIGWIAASLLKTEKFYDITGVLGSGTFCWLAIRSLNDGQRKSLSQKIQCGCVLAWALRLGSFLLMRILKVGHDRRFNNIKGNPGMFFITWTLQGLWVFITLLPSLIMWQKDEQKNRDKLHWRHYLGWTLWFSGFMLESLADYQKWKFRDNVKNENDFIRTGLWSISRHPNYLGEILLWFGLFISSSKSMKGGEYLSLLCPIFDALLITKISGIPILEKQALKKWGNNPEYLNYLIHTPVLIPYLW